MKTWLRTNQMEEIIYALQMVVESSSRVEDEPEQWKWLLLAMHNAVQGFMVLSLEQGNGLKALNDKCAAKWLKVYRDGGKYPKEKLDTFLNLYKKVKGQEMLGYVHSKAFPATGAHDESMSKLNRFRNEFIHFTPKGWSLEIAGLPRFCLNCLEVCKFLGWECGNVHWYKDRYSKEAKRELNRAVRNLVALESAYEAAAKK